MEKLLLLFLLPAFSKGDLGLSVKVSTYVSYILCPGDGGWVDTEDESLEIYF